MPAKVPTTLISSLPRPYIQALLPCRLLTPCSQCRSPFLPQHQPPHPLRTPLRPLTTTAPLSKKTNKQESKRNGSTRLTETEPVDPMDFSDYEAAIKHAHAHLKEELAKIKAGGRSAESVENVRIQLAEQGRKTTTPLRDVASVVPRGRNIAVLISEKDHVKPIMSALTSSSETFNPMSTAADPLTVLIPVPPTTRESREAAKGVAGRKGEEALFALREARGAQRKRLRGLELGKVIVPDEARRAEREIEKVNERAVAEGKRMVEGCRKGLEGG